MSPGYEQRDVLSMSRRVLRVAVVLAGVAAIGFYVAWLTWRYVLPRQPAGTPELVARIELHDPPEIALTQTFTATMEPYDVVLWYRDQEETWHGFYVDHEALRWQGRFEREGEDLVVFRSGRRVLLRFHIPTKTLEGPGDRKRRPALDEYERDTRPYDLAGDGRVGLAPPERRLG